MTDRPIDPTTRERLGTVSTATLATVLFKRGLRNQFIQGARRLGAGTFHKLAHGPWNTVEGSWLALLICLAVTLPLAALSYRFVEKPVLDWIARRQRATLTPA